MTDTDPLLVKSRKMQADLAKRVVWHAVQVLRHWDSLELNIAPGIPLNMENTAPGCIGFMPVFSSQEAAQTWRDENHPTARIVGIVAV